MTSGAVVGTGRGGAIPPPRSGDPAAALSAELDELEVLSRFERDDVGPRAEQAAAAARDLGLTDQELRARVVLADLHRKGGHVAEAGRRLHEILRWADDHDAAHLQSRAAFVLASVFQELGDLSRALEHAVRAVDLLAEDAVPEIRIDALARLADCIGLSGDTAARERYDQVLQLAQDLGDVERQLLVLNNRAYTETVAGAFEEALVWCTVLQDLAAEHDVPLRVGRLDTVVRALMELGRFDEAETAMLPGLRPEALDASQDGDAGADFLLTAAELRRRRGQLGAAQETLDECVRRCETYGLASIRVRARREQAELHAARGNFRAAYEEHKLYSDEVMEQQSAERDARARALQAMYEATEARRQSRRYRELSLRDPLTGLYNRRFVDDQLPRLLATSDEVTVGLLDLDHFKRINDTLSHDVGDRVLRAVAELLLEVEASADTGPGTGSFAARLGGEEFLLVLVGVARADGVARLDEVRRTLAAQPWDQLTAGLPVTTSIGATTAAPGESPADVLGRADAHLYRAKRQGRDRVVSDLG